MSAMKDYTGQRFGRLTALKRYKKGRYTFYTCKCDCGSIKDINGTSLTGGITKSCGCYRNDRIKETCTTHDMTGTKEYRAWNHMHGRCYTLTDGKYRYYGQRGIKVCDRWHKNNPEGFNNFLKDIGYAPSIKHTIHRIDNDKDYELWNCKWADFIEQNNTRSNSVRISIDGNGYTKAEAAKLLNVCLGSIEQYQSKGYTFDSIVLYFRSGPLKHRNKKLLVKKDDQCQS